MRIFIKKDNFLRVIKMFYVVLNILLFSLLEKRFLVFALSTINVDLSLFLIKHRIKGLSSNQGHT